MTTPRLTRIDLDLHDAHPHIRGDDECYFFFEYTSGKNYAFSKTNGLISNLKKKPSLAGHPSYRYKGEAMRECSRLFGNALNAEWLKSATLVPVPPSKVAGHPDYDPRMTAVCRAIPCVTLVDAREMVQQTESIEAAHTLTVRPTVADLLRIYRFNEAACVPEPTAIGIVDDVMTAGTHYRAIHTLLRSRFPSIPMIGLFLARRIFPPDEASLALDL